MRENEKNQPEAARANEILQTQIAARQRAERAWQASESRYRTLFEHATEGIVLADARTGEILDYNQAFAQLSGYDRRELIGKPQTVLHPAEEGNPTVSQAFAQHRDHPDGAVLAVDLVTDRAAKTPAAALADRILYRCLERGLSFKVSSGACLTLTPPLTVSLDDLDAALDILEAAMSLETA